MINHEVLGIVEEGVVLQERILERIALAGIELHIWHNAAPTIDGAAAVGKFHLAIRGAGFAVVFAIEIIVVKRNVGVVALNQTSAGRVVVSCGERESGIFGQRIDGLHQTLAECGFADDQATVVILNSSGDNFSRGSGAAVDQNHQRIFFAAVAVTRGVALLGRVAAVMGNNQLTFAQELVGDADTFAEQAAGILTEIENQT